jgi:serine/threonine protein kinase
MLITSVHLKRARSHKAKWESLCDRYLPITTNDSIWRYSRLSNPEDPEQGWKLHISATILSANKIFTRVAPYIKDRDVLFKAPSSLEELYKLNSGLYYGYSQVGKFITIYPRNTAEAVSMARELHRLTTGMPSPLVPFDSRFGAGSSVYYRYGSFNLQMPDGSATDALRDPGGKLIPDSRYGEESKPKWVVDPFVRPQTPPSSSPPNQGLSATPFRVIQALSQRGKGGVYQAVDIRFDPPRPCIIKQGRTGGEISWEGRDGVWMLKREAEILARLTRAGIEVPRVYAKFKIDPHYYLVMEQIEGETLQTFLEKRQRRLPIRRVLHFAKEISSLLARIHRAGWLWLDCKPANLVLTPNGKLRPLDFEGACSLKRSVSLDWQTPAFKSPPSICSDNFLSTAEDLYALGVTCYFLLTGRLPEHSNKSMFRRRHVPKELRQLMKALLDPDPRLRPRAEEVTALLASVETSLKLERADCNVY